MTTVSLSHHIKKKKKSLITLESEWGHHSRETKRLWWRWHIWLLMSSHKKWLNFCLVVWNNFILDILNHHVNNLTTWRLPCFKEAQTCPHGGTTKRDPKTIFWKREREFWIDPEGATPHCSSTIKGPHGRTIQPSFSWLSYTALSDHVALIEM